MTNSVDPDQTAPAVCSGSTLLDFYALFVSDIRQLFAADDFSRRHFQMHFFLALSGLSHENCLFWILVYSQPISNETGKIPFGKLG